ncbi:unnamed protein product [Linum trigynum]|uniref:Uncharacterized protein n=1 Tax=Linum trigynum TaxID=586398 RepID=A0AAV2CE99_9ROSI
MASLSHENWAQVEEHEGVLYIRAILNRGIGDCTVRHGCVPYTFQQELRAFSRGCNAQCDSVLKSITPYVRDAKVYFIYNNYSFTLNEINNLEDRKIVSNGKLTDSFLNLMRYKANISSFY